METRKERIQNRLDDPDFRKNIGFANEVGCHIVAYDPKDEFMVRHDIKSIIEYVSNYRQYRVLEFNLFKLLIQILKDEETYDLFLEYEANPINDRDRVTQLISNHAMPSDLVEKFKANVSELKEEDIIFVTGVGLMYPFINQKSILTVFHSFFKNNPVVYFLPGEYDGKVIKLFNTVEIDNYYRAFKLVEEGE